MPVDTVVTNPPVAPRPAPDVVLSPGDVRMRRVLRLPATIDPAASEAGRNAMTTSLLVSAVRCLLMYIVLPFVAPAVTKAGGVTGAIGLVVDVIALVAITASVRRFFAAHDRRRWQYTGFAAVVVCFLAVFLAIDVVTLVG